MSTGKRLAKRSIIGTRVCAPADDGKYYPGVIQAVKSGGGGGGGGSTRYVVRFERGALAEFGGHQLFGPGFQAVAGARLDAGQRVFITYNGREVAGEVRAAAGDLLAVSIVPPGHQAAVTIHKRQDDVRLLESRKSARLMDQDTNFARLADMAGDRRRTASTCIDVPLASGSRKRRPSSCHEERERDSRERDNDREDLMDECTAALVLMSLSCSPHSPVTAFSWPDRRLSPSPSSDVCSWRSATPSPPLSDAAPSTPALWANGAADEGIVMDVMDDFDELPRKKKAGRVVFQCTWPGCLLITSTCAAIESHVRKAHLGPRDGEVGDHEEEFYYTEVSLGFHTSSPPTLSHRDMARPPHEDPEYQRQLKQGHQGQRAGPINIPGRGLAWGSSVTSPNSPQKHMKLSPRSGVSVSVSALSLSAPNKLPASPTRKLRGDTKKCRKVYGMEHRDMWCTQCKWKKACARFGD